MPRPLTKVEQGYIRDCVSSGETDCKVIAKELKGVGPVTVQSFMDGLGYQKPEVAAHVEIDVEEPDPIQSEEDLKPKEGESEFERQERIASSRKKPGDFMLRDPERGFAAMTESAADMEDALKVHRMPEATEAMKERQKLRIHRPFEGERQGGAKDRSTSVGE